MDRNRQTLPKLQMALMLALVTVGLTGCGKPMLYHFKHYHAPFEAIARSNKTYFHSSQTGKIIEKDPCAQYCEPGCFGYEPTCWTRWPSECANCPVQGEVDNGMPYDGQIIMESAPVTESMGAPLPSYESHQIPSALPSHAPLTPQPTAPAADETRLPAIRVPSIPADVESAVPSPSDSTATEKTVPVIAEPGDLATRIAKAKPAVILKPSQPTKPRMESLPLVEGYQVPKGFATKPADSSDLSLETESGKAILPIKVGRTALPSKPKQELTTAVSTNGIPKRSPETHALRSTRPTSRRKPATLVEKLQVRAASDVKGDYLAAIQKTTVEDNKLIDRPAAALEASNASEEAAPKMLRIVKSSEAVKPAMVETPKATQPQRALKFDADTRMNRLASKLKKARPAPIALQKSELSPKTSDNSRKSVEPTKQTTLRVSDDGSSVIRFAAGTSKDAKKRIDASPDSTELRFSSK